MTAAAVSRLAPLRRYCWNAKAAETADPAGMLIAIADRAYVTPIARGIDIRTDIARRSARCCRANIAIDTASITAATPTQRRSALAMAELIACTLGSLPRSVKTTRPRATRAATPAHSLARRPRLEAAADSDGTGRDVGTSIAEAGTLPAGGAGDRSAGATTFSGGIESRSAGSSRLR